MQKKWNMEQKDWFEDWFDSPYYHILYKDRDEEEAKLFIDNLLSFVDLPLSSKVLDLACGKGRHAVYIGEKGFNTTGVDLSGNSIEFAKQFVKPNLSFNVHDMRKPFGNNDFDLVLNMFTSFGYFTRDEDNLSVFKAVNQSLVSEGLFLIDFMNVEKVIKELTREESREIDGINFEIKRYTDDSFLRKEINFKANNKTYNYKERVQLLKLSHFKEWVNATKFQIMHIFGDYSLNPFDVEKSDRLIMLLRKTSN